MATSGIDAVQLDPWNEAQAMKELHAVPIDKRRLSDGAKLPASQPTPSSRTS